MKPFLKVWRRRARYHNQQAWKVWQACLATGHGCNRGDETWLTLRDCLEWGARRLARRLGKWLRKQGLMKA